MVIIRVKRHNKPYDEFVSHEDGFLTDKEHEALIFPDPVAAVTLCLKKGWERKKSKVKWWVENYPRTGYEWYERKMQ